MTLNLILNLIFNPAVSLRRNRRLTSPHPGGRPGLRPACGHIHVACTVQTETSPIDLVTTKAAERFAWPSASSPSARLLKNTPSKPQTPSPLLGEFGA